MKKIIDRTWVDDIYSKSLNEMTSEWLSYQHDMARSKAAILIGLRINEDYNKYAKILLEEMNKDVHFLGVRLGTKSAWTIGVILIENLKPQDYPKIKQAFDKWDNQEKEDFLFWLKDFPEHIKVLKEGYL